MITKIPGVCNGAACIKNRPIPVWQVALFLRDFAPELVSVSLNISMKEIGYCIDYYLCNKKEIDEEMDDNAQS